MNALKEEIINIIRIITFNPDNTPELIGLIVVALLAAGLTLHYVSRAMGSCMAGKKQTIIILLLTILPIILITAVANVYCIPKIGSEAVRKWIPCVIAGILSLGIGIPSCRYFNKMKLSSSAFTITLTAAAIWGSTLLGSSAIATVKATYKQFSTASDRQEEIQKSIPR